METKVNRIPINNIVSFYEFPVSPINHVTIIADEQEVMGVGYAFSPKKSRLKALRDAIDKGYKDYVLPPHLLLINYQAIYKGNVIKEIDNLVVTSYWAKVYCPEFKKKIDELEETPWREEIADNISSEDSCLRFKAQIVPVEAVKEEDLLEILANGGKRMDLAVGQANKKERRANFRLRTSFGPSV